MTLSRDAAWQLLTEWTQSESLRKHALAVESAEELDAWRDYLRGTGVECSDVFERGGFRSIYVRDPDGHVVEIATRLLLAPRRDPGGTP